MFANMLLTLGSKIAVRLLGFVVLIFQTNYLAERYGVYIFVVQLAMALLALIDLGWSVIVVREINQSPEKAPQYLSNFLALETIVSAFFAFGFIAYVVLAGESPEKVRLVMLASLGVYVGGLARAPLGVLVATQRAGWASMADLGANLLTSVATLAVIYFRGPIAAFIWINNTYYLILFLTFSLMARRAIGGFGWRIDCDLWRTFLRQGLPSSMIAGTYVLYTTLDVIMLSRMSTDLRMSIYAVALKLTNPLLLFVEAAMMAVYPVLAARHASDTHGFRFLLNKSFKLMLGLGLPIALGITLLAGDIIHTLITEDLWEAVPTLRILIWRLPLLFAYSPINHALLAAGRLKTLAGVNLMAVGINFALNLLLIPQYQENGAAMATVGSHAVVLVFYLLARRFFFGVGMRWRDAAGLAGALAAMAIVIIVIHHAFGHATNLLTLLVLIAIGAATYFAAAFALRFLSADERQFLRSEWRRRMGRT